jgi:hypothetical protein
LIIQAKCVYHEVGDDFYVELNERRIKELAVLWLRALIAGLSPWSHGFDAAPVILKFVVEKVALGYVVFSEKEPRYPLNRRPGGPQSLSGRSGGVKTGIRAPNRPVRSLVSILTTLLQLLPTGRSN